MSSKTLTSNYIRAAFGEACDRPPIWLMRQAGRYMPSYQKLRAKYSFMTLLKTPALAAEITLQPVKELGVDAAILFSDILVTAEAMGLSLDYIDGKGPVFESTVTTQADVQALSGVSCIDHLDYVFSAIKEIKADASVNHVPLIGFAGAPLTVAAYMITGGGRKISEFKQWLHEQPDVAHALLDKLSDVTIAYINQQLISGVDAIQLFDTWAELLSWSDFETFSLPYSKKILSQIVVPEGVPVTFFCKGTSAFLPALGTLPCDVIGIDWQTNIGLASEALTDKAIQGNLDPSALLAPRPYLTAAIDRILSSVGKRPGFIFNLGHGVLPTTDINQVKYVIDYVQSSGT